jgi:hypothetical protein
MPTIGNTPRPGYVYDTETDTWVPIGVGAHTHDTLYINQNVIDAKGDLLAGTADNSYGRVPVGANGTVLVSDSTTSTGLAWQPYAAPFVAGKNKVINGDFGVWQRGASFTTSQSVEGYTADRWQQFWIGSGTTTFSRQAFTPGSAPVAGYEGSFFARAVTSANTTYYSLYQKIEDARTLAGQTVTISFWARATSTVGFLVYFRQNFGSGGSAEVDTTAPVSVNSSSWTRYSVTVSAPSVTGKTIGASSSIHLIFAQSGGTVASNTIDFWGVQVEAGPIATPFTTATGTIQGELAACQRYYYKIGPSDGSSSSFLYSPLGMANATTQVIVTFPFPQIMRIKPTSIEYTNPRVSDGANVSTATSLVLGDASSSLGSVNVNGSGFTVFRNYWMMNNSNSSLAFNAEL